MVEERIRELLGISSHETLIKIEAYERRNKRYYRLWVYDKKKKRNKDYHVPRRIEAEILELWNQYKREKEELRELEQEVKALLERYRDANKIREILEKLAEDSLIRTTSSYAIKTFTKKAEELFKEFLGKLLKLYGEGVLERLTILQALYILSNLKELSKSSENPEYLFKRGINTIIKVCKSERIENPFGTLKNDFFLSGRKTPYDFLLSNFLEELIGDTLLEILKTEYEKQRALKEAQKYKEKMEKLKEIVQWFEEQSPEVKRLAKTIVSQNVLEIAEKILKEMEMTKLSLKEVETFLKSYPSNRISQYFEYLKSL